MNSTKRIAFRIAVFASLGPAALVLASACGPAPELPRISKAPVFELTDQRQATFGSDRVLGKVWVANFIFTSCPDICPLLTSTMAGIQKDLSKNADSVHFLSFTVDPVVDTPHVLEAYASHHRVDQTNWSFLTGPPEITEEVVVKGFKQAQEEVPVKEGEPRNIRHGSHFVLVDGEGIIRGFYRSRGDGPVSLLRDARRLIEAGA